MEPFAFLDVGTFIDGDLRLAPAMRQPADPAYGWVPAYVFDLLHAVNGSHMGYLSLRVGNTRSIHLYAGHIGYFVKPSHRGQRYAARACRLVLPLARRHGIDPLWITVAPDNLPSRRTCESLGAELVEIVDVPPDAFDAAQGDRRKCRYRLSPAI